MASRMATQLQAASCYPKRRPMRPSRLTPGTPWDVFSVFADVTLRCVPTTPPGTTMPLRDIPQALEQEFITLSLEAGSPVTTAKHLCTQIIVLVERLGNLPEAECTHAHAHTTCIIEVEQENAVLEEALASETLTVMNLNRMLVLTRGTAAPAPGEREKIPDPEKYEGDHETLPEFLLQIRLKAPTLRDEQARLRYAVSLLKGRALAQIRPYVHADRVELENLEALITKLQAAFGDSDRRATAEKKLLTLKQTNKDFPSFYAEFSRYAADTDLDDYARRLLMRNALCYELKADLVGQAEPANFDDWIALLQRLDIKRRQLTAETPRRTVGSTPSTKPASSSTSGAPRSTATTGTASTATGTAPGPMDLLSGWRKLSLEERKMRMDEGRCMYCGGMGHMAKDCPNARRPLRVAEATLEPASEGSEN